MADFTDANDTAITVLDVVIGPMRVRFAEGKPATSIAVTSNSAVVSVGKSTLFDGPRGIHVVKLDAKKTGSAVITGTAKSGGSAKLSITVVDKFQLPARNTTEGLVARLLLAETTTPANSKYTLADAATCMERMILVLNNRLKNPGQFASRGTRIEDIITAPGQFEGFEAFPKNYAKVIPRIQGILDKANDNTVASQGAYQAHLDKAIELATKHSSPISDPSTTELIGWRTAGHGSPGPNFVAFDPPLMGIQFFQRK
jgi:hypothetical protein